MKKTVEHYLSVGFSQKLAEYFSAGRRRITAVFPNDNFTLSLSFDNGEKRIYNMAPLLLSGTVFAPLKELDIFRRVYLDDCNCVSWDIDPTVDSSLVWSNKLDLCPDECYVNSVPVQPSTSDLNNVHI